MKIYSSIFYTLYDQSKPVGRILKHYSVFRAPIFHDHEGMLLPSAKFHDFAIIWDEDHDERVIEIVEKIYLNSFLSKFIFFGEREGHFTALASKDVSVTDDDNLKIKSFCEHVDCNYDFWGYEGAEIFAGSDVYLSSINLTWELGSKSPEWHRIDEKTQLKL